MKLKDILSPTIKDFQKPSKPMIIVAYDSDLCQEVVSHGWLSEEQMCHAAERYRLGKSRSGKTIYWMIDELGIVHDGHLGDTWVSVMLKHRYPDLAQYIHPQHCLFGLHLLSHTESAENTERATPNHAAANNFCDFSDFCVTDKPVCVVESEASAVVLSELLPESLWMAYSYTANLTVDLLEPLQDRTVTIYPRTDPFMNTYLFFLDYADLVRRTYPSIDLSIDSTLEDHATDSQKSRCIDLLDFIFEE